MHYIGNPLNRQEGIWQEMKNYEKERAGLEYGKQGLQQFDNIEWFPLYLCVENGKPVKFSRPTEVPPGGE